MQIYETTVCQDKMPTLKFDSNNPPVEQRSATEDVLRAEYPYQVMIEAYLCTGERRYEQRRFCDIPAFDLCKKIGSVRTNDVLDRIFAFAEPRQARAFADRFGGLRYVMGRSDGATPA